MPTTKGFLQQECNNLGSVLEETLRFKYGLEGSKEFFDECQVRLKFISAELSRISDTDSPQLQQAAFFLVELSGLISRIERSSVGEYSWPFVEELKRIANAICTEATLTDPNALPKIHVLSDGGLDKYAIYTEANRPSSAGKRILTIVFPRSLKHFVLLHSILGHEIGHAMWQCSKHQGALKVILDNELFSGGVFADTVSTAKWLYSPTAPSAVKTQLASWSAKGLNQSNFFQWASWRAWTEEILCDFIGLLTFGPSFVAAESTLLYSLDPSGTGIGQRHPPVGCRMNYLFAGAGFRGFTITNYGDASLKSSVDLFWSELKGKCQPDPWFDVFSDTQIRNTADAIATLLQSLAPALYVQPTEPDLKHMMDQLARLIPPTGFQVDSRPSFRCRNIDFRQILFAGWAASANLKTLGFEHINRLCGHGILQQRAIDIELAP
jgi:hypothetical protein